MKYIFLYALLIFTSIVLISCEPEVYTGKVTFYTNAQVILNCGPFDVEIYIDNSLEGMIEEPFLPLGEAPACDNHTRETLLVLEKPEGNYEFTARLTCSETLKYLGEFNVKRDSCSLIYIDLTYGE